MTALHSFSYKITRLAGSDEAKRLKEQQLNNLKICKLIALVEITAVLIFVYNPMKSFIFKNELVSLLPIEIMFIDQNELVGFLLANCIMTSIDFYAVFGPLFVALNFYVMILNYSFQVDLIEFDVRRLDTFWSDPAASTLSERYSLLRNICQKCQDKDKYDEQNIISSPPLPSLKLLNPNLDYLSVEMPK